MDLAFQAGLRRRSEVCAQVGLEIDFEKVANLRRSG
jgi:hypothetical protein